MLLPWTCKRSLVGPLWPPGGQWARLWECRSLSVSGYGPSYLTNLFQSAASIHLHKIRSASSGGIHLPQVRTKMGKKSYAYRGVSIRWNALPPGLRTGRATAICSHLLTYIILLFMLAIAAWLPGTAIANWMTTYNYSTSILILKLIESMCKYNYVCVSAWMFCFLIVLCLVLAK